MKFGFRKLGPCFGIGLFGIFVVSVFVFNGPVFASSDRLKVHVLSLYSLSSVRIQGPGLHWQVGDGGEATLPAKAELSLQVSQGKIHLETNSTSQDISRLEVVAAPGTTMRVQGAGVARAFTGRLRVTVKNGALFFVGELPIEDYVAGVLGSELPEDFPAEAKKAQAILIRTYALSHRGRHGSEGFELCDTTHCQAFSGASTGGPAGEAAAATRGLILDYHGRPAETLYHSTCGGHTSPNQKVFGGKPLAYLQGVSDEGFCEKSPHFSWAGDLSHEELSRALELPVHELRPQDGEPQGRLFTLAVDGKTLPVMEFLSKIGQKWGWNRLKSNWFEVLAKGDGFHFTGHGLGHGVGLCQWGARGMAEAGKKFPEILQHYFPHTRLQKR